MTDSPFRCGRALLPLGFLLTPMAAAIAQTAPVEERVLSAVSVSAKKTQSQELRRNATAGKIVIDREELDSIDASSMAELLSKLPGGGNFTDMDGGPRGKQRSPDRNMPQILVDGQPLPGGGRNPMAALRLPVELIERVEIIRNSTAEFPVLSPGGVINLILRDVPSQLTRSAKVGIGFTDGEPSYRLEGQYGEPDAGDFGYLLSGAFNSRPMVGTQEMQAKTYTGGVLTDTIREKATQTGHDNNLTLSPRFSWNLGSGNRLTLTPFLTYTDSLRDSIIERDTSGVASTDRLRQETTRATGRLAAEWRNQGAGGSETTARLMLQGERDDSERTTHKYDAAGSLTANQRDKTVREESEIMLELRRKQLVFDSHLLTGAVEWRDKSTDDNQQRTGGGSSSSAHLTESRVVGWLQDEWQVAEQHVLTPGLRLQVLQTKIDDSSNGRIERNYNSVDPSLHYLWQVTDAWNFRASIAGNTRQPQTRDLSPIVREANGVNSSANPDRGGNSQLAPERLRSIELGIEHYLEGRGGTIGFSVFDRTIDNYVQRLIENEAGRWVERPRNVGKAQLRGGLVDFKAKMAAIGLPSLTLRGNLAYTDTKMLEQVAGLGAGEGPRKSANLGIDYEVPSWRLTMGGNYSYSSALDRESSATVRQQQGERKQLDLYALYKISSQTALRFSAQNVTREERTNWLQEVDINGLVSRTETDRTPGLASYFLTLETKW